MNQSFTYFNGLTGLKHETHVFFFKKKEYNFYNSCFPLQREISFMKHKNDTYLWL